jgi:hypothetical protein
MKILALLLIGLITYRPLGHDGLSILNTEVVDMALCHEPLPLLKRCLPSSNWTTCDQATKRQKDEPADHNSGRRP